MTPFKALYGRDPPQLIRTKGSSQDPPDVQMQLSLREELLQQLQSNLHMAQQHMKNYADKGCRPFELKEGDLVLVKLQSYRQSSIALRKHQKIGLLYFGPFLILHRIGDVAYKIQLPPEAKNHPVFHISQLKPFHGSVNTPYMPLPLTSNEYGPVLQPEMILVKRKLVQGGRNSHQILVKWCNMDEQHATWEKTSEFMKEYPNFSLEDKVNRHGGSDVKTPHQTVSKI